MIHINKTERYQRIWEDLKTVYVVRSTNSAYYLAGLTMGAEIMRGINELERLKLNQIFMAAANAKR